MAYMLNASTPSCMVDHRPADFRSWKRWTEQTDKHKTNEYMGLSKATCLHLEEKWHDQAGEREYLKWLKISYPRPERSLPLTSPTRPLDSSVPSLWCREPLLHHSNNSKTQTRRLILSTKILQEHKETNAIGSVHREHLECTVKVIDCKCGYVSDQKQ